MIAAAVDADRPKMASGGVQTLTISASTTKGTVLPVTTLHMIWKELACYDNPNSGDPTSTAVNPPAQVYLENAENAYFTWALPVSSPTECAAQWTYSLVNTNSVSEGD